MVLLVIITSLSAASLYDVMPQAFAQSNTAPTIVPPTILEYPELAPFELDFNVNDPDSGQTHTFTITSGNLTIIDNIDAATGVLESATGVLEFMPDETENGTYPYTIIVTDNHPTNPLSGSHDFTLIITEINVPPVQQSRTMSTVREGGTGFNSGRIANDPDIVNGIVDGILRDVPQMLTFSLVGDPPDGVTLSANGIIGWTPTETDDGTHEIMVRVSDGVAPPVIFTHTVIVEEVNQNPQRVGEIGDQTTTQNEEFILDVSPFFSDPDIIAGVPDALSYSLDNPPAWLSIADGTSQLRGTATQEIINSASSETLSLSVRATDTGSGSRNQNFDLMLVDVNEPPVIDAIPEQTGNEGELITFTVTATDPDRPPNSLGFLLDDQITGGVIPPGAVIDFDTGVFEWTPDESQGGTMYAFEVVVTDTFIDASEIVRLTVLDTNNAPVITVPTIEESYPELAPLELDFGVTDTEDPAQSHTFALTGTGSNLVDSFNTNTGILAWTPDENEDGTYSFTVTVTDDYGGGQLSDSHTFNLVISEVNTAPVLSPIGARTGAVGTAITFTASATDGDIPANTLRFTLVDGTGGDVPDGATIDETSGAFEWTPQESDVDEHTFDVVVSDGTDSDSQTVTVTVESRPNRPPVITVPTIASSYPEQVRLELNFDVTDPDSGQTHTFSLTEPNSGLVDSFDQSTGVLVWTPDETEDGTHSFTVTVTDNGNDGPQSDSHTFELVIGEVNRTPVLELLDALNSREFEAWPGVVNIIVTATDPDIIDGTPDDLTFSLVGDIPEGMTINPNTGAVSWTPNEDQDREANPYTITMQLSDGDLAVTDQITTRTLERNTSPVGEVIPTQTALLDVAFDLDASQFFSDPDVIAGVSDVITYTLDNPPAWLSIDPSTGVFAGTVTQEIIDNTPSNQITVTVVATDTTNAETRRSFSLMFAAANAPPVLAPIGDKTVQERMTLTFTVTATDPDIPANTLTFSLASGDGEEVPRGITLDPTSGVLEWTPGERRGGTTTTVIVRVFDGTVFDSETITITVEEVNSAPVLNAIPSQTGDAGTLITFTASATDSDSGPANTLMFSLEDGTGGDVPEGAAIDPASGVFEWTPTESQSGMTHTFDVVVFDGTDSDSQTVMVTINITNSVPVLTVPTIASSYPELVQFQLDFGVTDEDADQSHTFALTGTDSNLVDSFNTNTGILVWTPAENEDGTYSFTVTVTDDEARSPQSDSRTFDLVISEVNIPPTQDLAETATGLEGLPILFAFVTSSATDPDIIGGVADELTFSLVGNVPDGLTIDSSTGQLAWTPTEAQDGVHVITVQVTDGESPVTDTITITVDEDASPPVATIIPTQTATQDTPFTLDLRQYFSDEDVIAGVPDVITYTLDSPPSWISTDGAPSLIAGTATQQIINDLLPATSLTISVIATDIAGAEARQSFTLMLTDTNDEPIARSTLPTTHTVNEDTVNDTLDILSHYTDADIAPTLTLELVDDRGFATVDGDNLIFNPTNDHVGTNAVTFRVQDVADTPFNTGTVTVTVNNVNDAPTALIESLDTTFNEEFTQTDNINVLFADVDVGDTLTITHDGPSFVTFPENTVYSVLPTYTDAGTYAFTIVATDSEGATASIPVMYEVTNVNRAPVLQLPENLHLVPGTSYTFDLNDLFEDLDEDMVEFTFTYDGEMVPQDAFTIDGSMITFTLPDDADLSKELVATIQDDDPEPLTDTETVQYTYQPLTIQAIPDGDIMEPDMVGATDQASASFADESIPNVEIQPAASQTFEYSIVYYDLPAPSLARVDAPDVTNERLTTFNGNPIQFLNGVVDIEATVTGRTLVTLTYEEPVGLDESALSIWHFAKNRWSQLSSQTIDTEANTISGYTRSFSPFAIGTMLDAPRTDRSSSSSIEHLKAPTFGKSKLNNNQVVECGYSMDGQCIDVLGYHEEYLREVIQTNSTHDFTLKTFGQSPIRQFQIGFGVSGVGEPINNAEAVIRVAVTQDSKSAYTVDTVDIIDEHNTIDFEPQNAGVQKVSCMGDDNNNDDNDNNNNDSKTPQCVELTLTDVLFREQFHSEPFVIHVMDSSRRSSHNYMNEGLLVQGTSLNPAPTASKLGMPVGTSELTSFELTRTDKLADIWTDQFGHTWTQNSFGTWLQLTFPDIRHDSGDGGTQQPAKVMTRVHSDFADLVMGQQNRATLVFDAAGITNSIPETFSHDYYGTEHDLTKIQKLADQLKAEQERAQKILDAIMGRHSHTEGS